MAETARHALPLLSAGQAQKEVTHNEALLKVDRLLHVAVVTRGLSLAPAAPAPNACYIVGPVAGGAWAGREGQFACHDGYGWIFTDPVRGCLAWIIDEGCFVIFDTGWSDGDWPASGLLIGGRRLFGAPAVAVAAPTGGTVVDAEARVAVAALLTCLRSQGLVV